MKTNIGDCPLVGWGLAVFFCNYLRSMDAMMVIIIARSLKWCWPDQNTHWTCIWGCVLRFDVWRCPNRWFNCPDFFGAKTRRTSPDSVQFSCWRFIIFISIQSLSPTPTQSTSQTLPHIKTHHTTHRRNPSLLHYKHLPHNHKYYPSLENWERQRKRCRCERENYIHGYEIRSTFLLRFRLKRSLSLSHALADFRSSKSK